MAQAEAYVNLEYHWADYCAEADWNLRTDFAHPKSFEHEADGHGIALSAGWNVVWSDHWALNANFDYQDWSTDQGTDRTVFSDGSFLDMTVQTTSCVKRKLFYAPLSKTHGIL